MATIRKAKKFKLSDGRRISALELAAELNCSASVARSRLKTSKDPKDLFRPIRNRVSEGKYGMHKSIITDDGQEVTAHSLAKRTGLNAITILGRIRRGILDIDELTKPVPKKEEVPEKGWTMTNELKKTIHERNYFCPMSRLALRRI